MGRERERPRTRERRATRKFDEEQAASVASAAAASGGPARLPPVPPVDVALLDPVLLVGPLYIKDGPKWRLGEGFVSDRLLVFRVLQGAQTIVQVQYRLCDVVLLRILNFAQYFDHYCFEVHVSKVELDPRSGLPKLSGDVAHCKSVVTFRCLDAAQLMDWIDALDDASDGVWLADGLAPAPPAGGVATARRLLPATSPYGQPLPAVTPVVGGAALASTILGVAPTVTPPTTTTASDGRSSEVNTMDWSVSSPGDHSSETH